MVVASALITILLSGKYCPIQTKLEFWLENLNFFGMLWIFISYAAAVFENSAFTHNVNSSWTDMDRILGYILYVFHAAWWTCGTFCNNICLVTTK